MNIEKELTNAYVAGFLDGEGTIGITKLNEPDAVARIRHRLYVSLTNCNRDILLFVQGIYGGSLAQKKRKNPKHRIAFVLKMEGQIAIKFLKQVYPYLKIKRLQAEVAFQFAKTLRTIEGNTRRPISSYILSKREGFYSRIKNMNLRGSKEVMPDALR